MKKLFESIIAAMLIAVIAVTALGTDTAYAAEKEMPVNVTFNKKTVNVSKKSNMTLKNLKSKWGKPKKSADDYYGTIYTWKKGKTSIEYSSGHDIHICVNIDDKNATICGVKVGMKKDKVLKKLKKLSGKSVVFSQDEDGIYVYEYPKYEVIEIPTFCLGANIFVKNGKVTGIFYERHYGS